jgi:hypothetical protein
VPLRPLDPTTSFVWSSRREQGATVPPPVQPESRGGEALAVATPLARRLDLIAEPARIDVATLFPARGSEGATTPASADTGSVREAATARMTDGPSGAWLRDDVIMAALADASRAPVAPAAETVAALDTPAAAETAADESRESEGGQRTQEKGSSSRWATAWLLVLSLAYGLWQQQGWASLHDRKTPRA